MKRILLTILITSALLLSACASSEPKVLPYPGPGAPPPPVGYTYDLPPTPAPESTTPPAPAPAPLSFDELRAESRIVSYQDMFRNIEAYIGERLYYQGQVSQVVDQAGNLYTLRVLVTQEEYGFWTDDIMLYYIGSRVLEDDNIEFVGTVLGTITYTTVLGAQRTIPELNAIELRLMTSSTESAPATSPEPEPEPEIEPSAEFRIKDWEQDYWEVLDEWDEYVKFYYEVENTGDVDIDYYEVFFVVKCVGGKEYNDWTNGTNVRVGKKITDSFLIDVNGREVQSIKIDDWELTSY